MLKCLKIQELKITCALTTKSTFCSLQPNFIDKNTDHISKNLEVRQKTPLHVVLTLFSVFGNVVKHGARGSALTNS